MQPDLEEIMKKDLRVSVTELKRIAVEIKEHSPGTCIRFRLLGRLWQQHFCRIVTVSDDRILVNDETSNRLLAIDLRDVVQFELDNRFQQFEPNNHYEVAPAATA